MIGQMILMKSLEMWQQAAPLSPDTSQSEAQLRQQVALEAIRSHPGRGVDILVPLAFFAFIALIVWMGSRRKHVQIQVQAELQKQLLAKFASGQELAGFLETPGGQRFLDQLSTYGAGTKGRVLGSLRAGIVLSVLGVGMLILSATRQQHGMLTPAVLVLAIGIGFLISTAISHRLSNKWEQNQKPGTPPAPIS